MKIIATSNGISGGKIKKELQNLIVPGQGAESTIAICCNALRYQPVRWVFGIARAMSFRAMGYSTVHVDLARISSEKLVELCGSFQNLYLGPGDTRRLLMRWQAEGLGSLLLEHIKQHNGTMIGESAGSILFGASIKTADYLGDSQSVQLDSLQGLGLFSDLISLFVHGNSDKEDRLRRAIWEMKSYSQVVNLPYGEAYVKYADGSERRVIG